MSDSYRQTWLRDLRLCLLKILASAPGHSANTSVLQQVAESFGFRVTRPQVNTELGELEGLGGVKVEQLQGDLHVAELTQRGLDHVERRIVLDGVKRPSLS